MPGQIYWICEPLAADAGAVPTPAGWQLQRLNTMQALQADTAPTLLIVDQLRQQAVPELAALGRCSIRVLTVPDCQDEQLLPFVADFHLFYPQPLQPQALKQLIRIAQALAALKLPPACRDQLLACTHLPVIPPVIRQLQQLLQDPDVRIDRLAEVIEQDLVLSARLLQLANSAYMGFNHETASVQMAVSRLGLSLLYGLLLALSVTPELATTRRRTEQDSSGIALAIGSRQVGQWLGLDSAASEQVVVCALFYQLGQALLQGASGDVSAVDPAQAGAFMLTLWGFTPTLAQLLLQQQDLAGCRDKPMARLYLARQRQQLQVPDAALAAVLQAQGSDHTGRQILSPRQEVKSAMVVLSQTELAVLQADPWFAALTPPQQLQLLQQGRRCTLGSGQQLFDRGADFCGIYVLLQGQLLISGLHPSGQQALLTLITPGQWFGEIAWFDQMARTHDAGALTDCQLLQLPKTALQQLVSSDPLWWQRFGQLLTGKLRQLFIELEDRALLPASQRLARRLCQLCHAQQQIPLQQEQLGQLLSLSRQTTNQLLRQLAQAGIIRTRYGIIEVLNRPALWQLARHGADC